MKEIYKFCSNATKIWKNFNYSYSNQLSLKSNIFHCPIFCLTLLQSKFIFLKQATCVDLTNFWWVRQRMCCCWRWRWISSDHPSFFVTSPKGSLLYFVKLGVWKNDSMVGHSKRKLMWFSIHYPLFLLPNIIYMYIKCDYNNSKTFIVKIN